MARVHNFYPGPAALPLEALETAQEELLDFQGTGMSIMETSHRSKVYDGLHNETISLFKELLGLGDEFKVLLLQGGASLQFAMVPMNLLGDGRSADYILTGSWSKKAFKEANIIGTARIAATTEEENGVFFRIPKQHELALDENATYCHITSNNTIFGTQWHNFPDTGEVPLVADMSSDILSRRFNPKQFGIFYAGAQKNLGPAGVTAIAIREDMIEKMNKELPTLLSYHTHIEKNSLFNTPPCFAIYMMNQVLKWVRKRGGLDAIEEENRRKAELIYSTIDENRDFFRTPIEPDNRSFMNVVFRLPNEELEKKFIEEGAENGFIGLKGHRSVGGIRISIYNANTLDSVRDIVSFMKDFAQKYG